MPVARIVTSTPEQVSAAADHLRARGFSVEVAAPGQAAAYAADVELDAVGMDGPQALVRAVEAVGTSTRRAIAYDITGRPVEFEGTEEEAPSGSWLARFSHELVENLRLPISHLREWVQEGRQSLETKRAERQTAQEEMARTRLAQKQQAEADRAKQMRENEVRLAAENEARARSEAEERARQAIAERERQQALEREQFARDQREAAQRVAPAQRTMRRHPQPSGRDRDWRKAMVTAAVLALLATLVYGAYESRRPASPLSNRDLVRSQSIAQPVPFGAATATPPQAPTRSVLPQSSAAPSSDKPAPAPPAKLKRQTRHLDGSIAEDEVIVHRSSAPSGTPVAKGSGVKRYSDLQE